MPDQLEQLETPAQRYKRLAEKEAIAGGLSPEETGLFKEAQVAVGLSDHVHDRDQAVRRTVIGGSATAQKILDDANKAIAAATEAQAELREKNKTIFARFDEANANLAKAQAQKKAAEEKLADLANVRKTRKAIFA